ncbi:MAG: hypothetical protein OCD01_15085 [Fibrobacterales bacterium]
MLFPPLKNCFYLVIPILIGNILWSDLLPAPFQENYFWKDIPWVVSLGEHSTRIVLLSMLLFIPFSLKASLARAGFMLFILGTILYGFSWVALIHFPDSFWSSHTFGFSAPAYTPILWLSGLGCISIATLGVRSIRTMLFLISSLLFIFFHLTHTLTIYYRLPPLTDIIF